MQHGLCDMICCNCAVTIHFNYFSDNPFCCSCFVHVPFIPGLHESYKDKVPNTDTGAAVPPRDNCMLWQQSR